MFTSLFPTFPPSSSVQQQPAWQSNSRHTEHAPIGTALHCTSLHCTALQHCTRTAAHMHTGSCRRAVVVGAAQYNGAGSAVQCSAADSGRAVLGCLWRGPLRASSRHGAPSGQPHLPTGVQAMEFHTQCSAVQCSAVQCSALPAPLHITYLAGNSVLRRDSA